MTEITPEEWERAQYAFQPFLEAFRLPLNPEDVDEILYAVLHHGRSTAPPEQILAEVEAQVRDHVDRIERTWEALALMARSPGEGQSVQEPAWVLWRQDDNGNRFEVGRFSLREQADRAAAEYEARRHKQTYWV